MSTITDYRRIAADLPRALGRVAREPQVEREVDYYRANIGKVLSLDDFLGNDRIYRFALTAFGMEDMVYAKALVRRALAEGVDRREAFANRLADPRYRELAATFNFARYGSATTTFARTQQGTIDRYIRNTLETEAGSASEGVRLALYFQRKASDVRSPYALLADRALLKVTQVALDIPESAAKLDVDRQAELISRKLPIGDLASPAKLDKLLTRFLAVWDIEHPAQGTTANATALFGRAGSGLGDISLLERMQKTRRGT